MVGAAMAPMGTPVGPVQAPSDKTRRTVGFILWVLAILAGILGNILFFGLEIFSSKNPGNVAAAMFFGAIPALGMLIVYLPIPAILDRADPEPWWCLAMAFLWGALFATGFSGFANTVFGEVVANTMGRDASEFLTPVVSAPIMEEASKGLCVLGFFYFMRREFDGVVDGIIYATMCALGFAAVENIAYYGRAALQGDDVFAMTFVIRGVIAPWGHPLYTSMTGIGLGIARESEGGAMKIIGPLGGFCAAMFLHAVWNFVPNLGTGVFLVSLLFWFVFVGVFLVIVIVLVRRKGRIIAEFLRDEVLVGNLTPAELALITSTFGRFTFNGNKRDFIRAGARLALAKWHTSRAMKGRKQTISVEFIGPMRQELQRLRHAMGGRVA
jgi:RsiW-degrading membrane proteinase PrsW (M82 family)